MKTDTKWISNMASYTNGLNVTWCTKALYKVAIGDCFSPFIKDEEPQASVLSVLGIIRVRSTLMEDWITCSSHICHSQLKHDDSMRKGHCVTYRSP